MGTFSVSAVKLLFTCTAWDLILAASINKAINVLAEHLSYLLGCTGVSVLSFLRSLYPLRI